MKFIKDYIQFMKEDLRSILNRAKNYEKEGYSITMVNSKAKPLYFSHLDTIDAWCYSANTPNVEEIEK